MKQSGRSTCKTLREAQPTCLACQEPPTCIFTLKEKSSGGVYRNRCIALVAHTRCPNQKAQEPTISCLGPTLACDQDNGSTSLAPCADRHGSSEPEWINLSHHVVHQQQEPLFHDAMCVFVMDYVGKLGKLGKSRLQGSRVDCRPVGRRDLAAWQMIPQMLEGHMQRHQQQRLAVREAGSWQACLA